MRPTESKWWWKDVKRNPYCPMGLVWYTIHVGRYNTSLMDGMGKGIPTPNWAGVINYMWYPSEGNPTRQIYGTFFRDFPDSHALFGLVKKMTPKFWAWKPRWWFQICLLFSSQTLGLNDPIWRLQIFQMGWWTNHPTPEKWPSRLRELFCGEESVSWTSQDWMWKIMTWVELVVNGVEGWCCWYDRCSNIQVSYEILMWCLFCLFSSSTSCMFFYLCNVTFDMSLIPFMRLLVRSVLCNELQESVLGSRSMTCWLKILRSKSARKKNVQWKQMY